MATQYSVRYIIVVTAADAAIANAAAKTVDLVGGEKTFTSPLSPTGALPATHYWCNWAMTPAQATELSGKLDTLLSSNRARAFDAVTTTPDQVLTTLGLKVVAAI